MMTKGNINRDVRNIADNVCILCAETELADALHALLPCDG